MRRRSSGCSASSSRPCCVKHFGKLSLRGDNLRVAHLNMRSLNTCFDEMCSHVCDFEFDVFGVTETWLHPDTPSDNYNIPGYTMLSSDRQQDVSHRHGGGIAVYIKEGIVHELHQFAEPIDPGIE